MNEIEYDDFGLELPDEILKKLREHKIYHVDELVSMHQDDVDKIFDWFTRWKIIESALKEKGLRLKTAKWRLCPKCGSEPDHHEVRNHSMMWHDGAVYCLKCGAYVRMWDAG